MQRKFLLLCTAISMAAALLYALPQQPMQTPATAIFISQLEHPQWFQLPDLATFELVTEQVIAPINFVSLLVLAATLVLIRIRHQSKGSKQFRLKTLMRIWRASSLNTRERQRTYAL